MFQLFTAAVGAGFQIAGGLSQAAQIRKTTEERLRQMRLQRDQAIGRAVATAGASGVEMTSSTIQNHLRTMGQEWWKALDNAEQVGDTAAFNSTLSGFAGGASTAMQGLSNYAQELDALGSKPMNSYAPIPPPTPRNPITYWGD